MLAKTLKYITESDREELRALIRKDVREAGKLATVLAERSLLRRANHAFLTFKNHWVIDALYFSPDVTAVIVEANPIFAYLSVIASEMIEEPEREPMIGERKKLAEYVEKLEAIAPKLRTAMQAEMYPETTSLAPA